MIDLLLVQISECGGGGVSSFVTNKTLNNNDLLPPKKSIKKNKGKKHTHKIPSLRELQLLMIEATNNNNVKS